MDSPGWITVVSGLPRSGTSMMMQMLDAGGVPALCDQARGPDADNPRGYYEFEAVKRTRRDASWLPAAVGRSVKMVHLLLYDLPDGYEYRVLLMRRNMEQVLASQAAMLRRLGRAGAAVRPEQLAATFGKQLEQVEQWLAGKGNFSVLQVDYNRVLAAPPAEVARVNQFLGGGLDEPAMARAIEPSLYRNRG